MMAATEVLYNWTWNGYNPISVGWNSFIRSTKNKSVLCEYHTVHYVLSGEGSYTVSGREYPVKAGDLITVTPGGTFCCQSCGTEPMAYVWVTFALCGKVPYRFVTPYIHAPQLHEVFNGLRQYPDHENTGRDYTAGCLNKIAAVLLSENDGDIRLVNEAVGHMQSNFRNAELSVAELAKRMGVPQFQLTRAFGRVKNMPPMEYLVRYRMEKACQYIRMQKGSLKPVAEYVGYGNYTTFARMFRKYYGITPKEYKNKHLK